MRVVLTLINSSSRWQHGAKYRDQDVALSYCSSTRPAMLATMLSAITEQAYETITHCADLGTLDSRDALLHFPSAETNVSWILWIPHLHSKHFAERYQPIL
ncbi:uncharacterized protein LOC143269052 [Peromyscus maniculatus bairdii]|uniref:uncharacterized protein LOC143269052 n=1 Tax=Peromyscus maniculatus bairdii TaxID=230844 RepID=UPI003FD39ECB